MAELEVIDYSEIALSLLIERFKDSTEVKKLLKIMMDSVTDLQDSVFTINDLFELATAAGPELTTIGAVWDVSRRLDITETDDEYRIRIAVRAVLSLSGTIPEIKEMLYLYYGATYINYSKAYPAGFNIITDADISEVLLNKISPAGVQGYLGTRLLALTFSYPLGELSVLKATLAGE